MRIYISTNNKTTVPFDHTPLLVGTIHKWLGENNPWHGRTSLASFSWLQGGRKRNGGLYFPNGASFFISAYDDTFIKNIIKGAMDDPQLFASMEVRDIQIRETPIFDTSESVFSVASPVLIKKKEGSRVKHCLFDDPESNEVLTQSMRKKMSIAGMDDSGMSIRFDPEYQSAHSKLVNYNGIKNRASVCPVIIKGTPEQIAFAWNVGVGNSTGIGFGALN